MRRRAFILDRHLHRATSPTPQRSPSSSASVRHLLQTQDRLQRVEALPPSTSPTIVEPVNAHLLLLPLPLLLPTPKSCFQSRSYRSCRPSPSAIPWACSCPPSRRLSFLVIPSPTPTRLLFSLLFLHLLLRSYTCSRSRSCPCSNSCACPCSARPRLYRLKSRLESCGLFPRFSD